MVKDEKGNEIFVTLFYQAINNYENKNVLCFNFWNHFIYCLR